MEMIFLDFLSIIVQPIALTSMESPSRFGILFFFIVLSFNLITIRLNVVDEFLNPASVGFLIFRG